MQSFALKFAITSLALLVFASAARAQQPNLIVIMSDDHGTNAVSAYGPGIGGVVATPNIDRIATEGVTFTNAFTVDQVCAPNRATLMTGKYAHKHGVQKNGDIFDASQTTVVDLLKAAGYRTAIIGKWHLLSSPGHAGFDYWNVIVNSDLMYSNIVFNRNGVITATTGYVTDVITADAIAWLTENSGDAGPFALFIMHKAPHGPFVPALRHQSLYPADLAHPATFGDRWTGRAEPAQQARSRLVPDMMATWLSPAFQALGKAMLPSGLSTDQQADWIYQQYAKDYLRTLAGLDESVGTILDHLDSNHDETGLLSDDTVVIFTSDHGNLVGEHFSFGKRRPYEEVLRVPFLMRYPGVSPGSVVHQTVLNTDTAPTLLKFAGVAIPGDMQGASLLDLLGASPPANWRSSFYFHHYQWDTRNVVPYYGIRTPRYKLINHYGTEWGGEPAWELIDLQTDPDELTNVFDQTEYSAVIRDLKWELATWQAILGIQHDVVACPGDMNGDGYISHSDVFSVKSCLWSLAEGACLAADFDGNAVVNSTDLIRATRVVGKTCPD